MMKTQFLNPHKRPPVSLILVILILLILIPAMACNLPFMANEETILKTVNAQLTEDAIQARGTGQSNAGGLQTLSPPQISSPTNEGTLTITTTATITLTPTLENPMIYATTDTNCRYGPGTMYDIVGYLLVGNKVPVLGKLQAGGWWYIQHPTRSNERCWVWASSTVVEGDTSKLPFITPPPTPTPTRTNTSTPFAAFTASFSNVHVCGGAGTMITYQVANTGNLGFESGRVDITDISQATSSWTQMNLSPFYGSSTDCPPNAVSSMGPGSTYFIMHGPATITPLPGDNMQSVIKLCTEDNLGGTCVSRTITFVYPAP